MRINLLSSFIILLFLIASTSELKSQNIFFEPEQNGLGLAGQYTSTDEFTLLGIIPSYTINGRLSLGVNIGTQTFKDETLKALDITATSIRPYISYLITKQNVDKLPVSIAIGGGYQYTSFSNLDLTADIISFGLSLTHQIDIIESLSIYPTFELGWGKTSYSNTNLEDESGIAYAFSVPVRFKSFYITPLIKFYNSQTTFNLVLGFILPF